ncbi:GFA family protein [Pleionea sp. CnH1-48]|uniref:GFA family protein n=1 Tax=Pleionea sp. CnH1-48 TaxID=2954494 RepID=UPI002096E6E1|nr:GFA family protein [Pleionea sp. CnH1-48]MCO7226724.1 GFA family protein [Pleionea sp. CnH1-48]
MANTHENKGSCLCGAVKVSASQASDAMGACHCSMCRNWGGGPFLTLDCGTDVEFDGEEMIGVYSSSDWAERGFCKQCGSHLFYRLKPTGQLIMSAGIFDQKTNFDFDHQIFIDEKPEHYAFVNQTENMTGAEVFAKYAPPE